MTLPRLPTPEPPVPGIGVEDLVPFTRERKSDAVVEVGTAEKFDTHKRRRRLRRPNATNENVLLF